MFSLVPLRVGLIEEMAMLAMGFFHRVDPELGTPLYNHVVNVLSWTAEKEMRWIYASPIIAAMEYPATLWYLPEG